MITFAELICINPPSTWDLMSWYGDQFKTQRQLRLARSILNSRFIPETKEHTGFDALVALLADCMGGIGACAGMEYDRQRKTYYAVCYVQYPDHPDWPTMVIYCNKDYYYIGKNTTRIIEKRFNIRKGVQP